MIEGTVVGQSGMADAQLGPSIDMSSAERVATKIAYLEDLEEEVRVEELPENLAVGAR